MNERLASHYQFNIGEEMQKQSAEALLAREGYFVPASLKENMVFCGDEREPDTDEIYLHLFGGALNPVKGLIVMNEVMNPGSTVDSFEESVRKYMPAVIEIGGMAHPGVHSDVKAETNGESLDREGVELDLSRVEGPVGCGYAQVAQAISEVIAVNGEEIIREMQEDTPYLFAEERGLQLARDVVEAHKRLARNEKLYTSGRLVVLAAAEKGAKTMNVRGNHCADVGIINMDRGSTAKSGQAIKEGLPFYLQDSGTAYELYENMQDDFGYDLLLARIAEQIDTRGTMKALGVKTIAVREPSTIHEASFEPATASQV
jgi:hypothetical protein